MRADGCQRNAYAVRYELITLRKSCLRKYYQGTMSWKSSSQHPALFRSGWAKSFPSKAIITCILLTRGRSFSCSERSLVSGAHYQNHSRDLPSCYVRTQIYHIDSKIPENNYRVRYDTYYACTHISLKLVLSRELE